MAVERIGSIIKHLAPGSALNNMCVLRRVRDRRLTPGSSQSKNADDIVITLAIRTPLCKAKKGGFKDTSLEYMVYALLKEVRLRSNLDPALVEDIALGNVCIPPYKAVPEELSADIWHPRSRTARPRTRLVPPPSPPASPTRPAPTP